MSNEEHLIENAIACLRDDKSLEDFVSREVNRNMAKESFPENKIENTLLSIWKMATHVCFTWFYNETFEIQKVKPCDLK